MSNEDGTIRMSPKTTPEEEIQFWRAETTKAEVKAKRLHEDLIMADAKLIEAQAHNNRLAESLKLVTDNLKEAQHQWSEELRLKEEVTQAFGMLRSQYQSKELAHAGTLEEMALMQQYTKDLHAVEASAKAQAKAAHEQVDQFVMMLREVAPGAFKAGVGELDACRHAIKTVADTVNAIVPVATMMFNQIWTQLEAAGLRLPSPRGKK